MMLILMILWGFACYAFGFWWRGEVNQFAASDQKWEDTKR